MSNDTVSTHLREMKNIGVIIFVFILCSCVGNKESREIKRKSKIIEESEILLQASSDGAASYMIFKLRENRFFNIDEGVMFWWDYYAGTWEMSEDTLNLNYINSHKRDDLLNCAIIDTVNSIIFI